MKQAFTFLVLFFSCFALQAQSFAPIGAVWHYDNQEGMGPQHGYVRIEATADTVIQGHNCRILEKWKFGSSLDTNLLGRDFVYQQGDSIFRMARDGQFYLLYDFGAQVGAQWELHVPFHTEAFNADSVVTIRVDSVSTYVLGGRNLRHLFVSTVQGPLSFDASYTFGGSIIEQLGGMSYMLPQELGYIDVDHFNDLRCYQDDSLSYTWQNSTIPCDYLTVGINKNQYLSEVHVYPNPSKNSDVWVQLPSNFDATFIQIFDASGRLISEENLENQGDKLTISLPYAGYFFVKIQNLQGQYLHAKALRVE